MHPTPRARFRVAEEAAGAAESEESGAAEDEDASGAEDAGAEEIGAEVLATGACSSALAATVGCEEGADAGMGGGASGEEDAA
jgi:hypothetical protein